MLKIEIKTGGAAYRDEDGELVNTGCHYKLEIKQ